MNIYFIGMGYMGQERLKSIINVKNKFNLNIIGYYDPKIKYLKIKNCEFQSEKKFTNEILLKNNISLCFISTPHNLVKKYSILCLDTKLPISLVIEKPFGLNAIEAKQINSYKTSKQKIFVGLNYRFFYGIQCLLKDIKKNKFGKLYSVQVNFGHGHQPDILNSWKLKKKFAGGGVIIDPGIHIINLIQLFSKNLNVEYVKKMQNFWKTKVEDEAVIILSAKNIPIINISLSITKWRSTFEIIGNGEKGYWRLFGRDRSYGEQKYITGKRWAWLLGKDQKDTEKLILNPKKEDVFKLEILSILNSIKGKKVLIKPCDGFQALKTMKLIKKIYDY